MKIIEDIEMVGLNYEKEKFEMEKGSLYLNKDNWKYFKKKLINNLKPN